jgi:hypothetical protein
MSHQRAQCAERRTLGSAGDCAAKARIRTKTDTGPLRAAHPTSDDDNPPAIVAAIVDALPPDSYLVLSHVTGDIRRESAASAAVHYKKVSSGATLRGQDEILRFFAGLELIDPGLVQVPHWRPDGPEPAEAGKVWILGGVGRKPGPSPAERM